MYNTDAQGNPIPSWLPSGSTIYSVQKGRITYSLPGSTSKIAVESGSTDYLQSFANAKAAFESGQAAAGTSGSGITSAEVQADSLIKPPKPGDVEAKNEVLTPSGSFYATRPEDTNIGLAPTAKPAASSQTSQVSSQNAQPTGGVPVPATGAGQPQAAPQMPSQGQQAAGATPEFVNLNGAYFRQTDQGLAAVNDQKVLQGLQSGQIPSTKPNSLPTAGDSFASVLSSEAGPTTKTLQTYDGLSQKYQLPPAPQGQQMFSSDPIGTIQQLTSQILGTMGFGEANTLITSISKEIEDLQNKRDARIRAINDDPWLTEGVRLRRIQSVSNEYEDRIGNRTNQLQLLENTRKDAQQQAQFALGTAISLWDSERQYQAAQVQAYYDQAQQQFDNQVKLAELSLKEQAANAPDKGTSDMQEYLFAVENGQFSGSFLDFKRSAAAAVRAPSTGGGGISGAGGENPQLYGGLTPQTATAVRSLVGKYSSEPIVQNFATIQDGYIFSQNISSDTQNPADDQALIYSLAKTLDPGSVVREGEYATAQKYAQSWINAYGKSVTQAIAGTGFLSREARENIKNVIETKYQSSATSYNSLNNQYVNRINNLTGRGDGSQFLIDYTTQPAAPTEGQPGFIGPVSVSSVFDEVVTQPDSGGFFSNFLKGLFGG